MAMPSAYAGLLQAAPPGPRRPGRWRPALLLAAVVAGWHAWLVDRLAPPAAPAGPPRPGVVQLRSLPPATAVPAQVAPGAPVAEVAKVAPEMPVVPRVSAVPAPRLPAAPLPPDAPAGVPDPGSLPAALAPPSAGPGGSARPPAAVRHVAAVTADATAGTADATGKTTDDTTDDTAVDGATDAAAAGVPPPLYPTHPPPPTQLRYALLHNGQAGEALLAWQHDGRRYQLTLQAQTAAGAPLLQQASAGLLEAHGLVPDRFTDRRRQGRTQAANFRHDIGRIGYSGPPQQHPAWPGAQDRLSWLAQLVAVLAAAGDPVPAEVTLFVTDARGHAGLWPLRRQPDGRIDTPGGLRPVQRWLREPPRPEGLRVEVWLPADPGGPAGPWPLRLLLQVPRSGHTLVLQRAAPP